MAAAAAQLFEHWQLLLADRPVAPPKAFSSPQRVSRAVDVGLRLHACTAQGRCPQFAEREDSQPQGTWVYYRCLSNTCNGAEKVFEGK